jgi:hypothetical protein
MAALVMGVPAKAVGSFKILSYNVNGIRAAVKKPLLAEWIAAEDPGKAAYMYLHQRP